MFRTAENLFPQFLLNTFFNHFGTLPKKESEVAQMLQGDNPDFEKIASKSKVSVFLVEAVQKEIEGKGN